MDARECNDSAKEKGKGQEKKGTKLKTKGEHPDVQQRSFGCFCV